MKYSQLIAQMTLEEKVGLCSGKDLWRTKPIERLGVPSVMVADGPNGVRAQHGKDTRVNVSERATCFPTSATVACSWDKGLAEEVGAAIGAEALKEDVQTVLGPGVNIKRSPLCGRNFEYYSEDPVLAGEMGAAFIRGVQSNGVGACVKHFAVNNQETFRNSVNAVVDERALREIYLKAFEIAVKKGKPAMVMASYNRVNGAFATQNKFLLTDVLRGEWGFDGVVVSDWNAVYDRAASLEAGLDLEMPFSGVGEKVLLAAVKEGKVSEAKLDESVDRLLSFIFEYDAKRVKGATIDAAKHDELARRAAAESAVLLKNTKRTLPLRKSDKVLVVGEFAQKPRFQGAGSSFINPRKITTLIDALDESGVNYAYERGYDLRKGKDSSKLIEKAVAAAANFDKIVVMAGLSAEYEAEGFDRKNIDMPEAHNTLIKRLAATGKDVIVVLSAGAPVAMPWIGDVSAAVMAYLGGQASGAAIADILTGKVNPSGKLAETYPVALDNLPSMLNFPGSRHDVVYKEGMYVGYRYTEKVDAPVLFPFGYGLSYTDFSYGEAKVEGDLNKDGKVKISVEVSNVGDRDGKETVQVYLRHVSERSGAPNIRLVAFDKQEIAKKSSKNFQFSVDKNDFLIYDRGTGWMRADGDYEIVIASNIREPKQQISVHLDGQPYRQSEDMGWYSHPDSKTPIGDDDFRKIYGAEPDVTTRIHSKGEFTLDDSIADMAESSGFARFVQKAAKFFMKLALGAKSDDDPNFMMSYEMFRTSPMTALCIGSRGAFSLKRAQGLVDICNGHVAKGLKSLLMAM